MSSTPALQSADNSSKRPFHGMHPCKPVKLCLLPFMSFFFRLWRKKKDWKGSTDNRIPKYLVSTLDCRLMTNAATCPLFKCVKWPCGETTLLGALSLDGSGNGCFVWVNMVSRPPPRRGQGGATMRVWSLKRSPEKTVPYPKVKDLAHRSFPSWRWPSGRRSRPEWGGRGPPNVRLNLP